MSPANLSRRMRLSGAAALPALAVPAIATATELTETVEQQATLGREK